MLASVKIVTVPAAGTLALDGTAVMANGVVTKAQIDADMLVFTPAQDAHGDPYTSFTFKVNDGTVDSTATYTMTIDVTDAPAPVCAAPSFGDRREIWTGTVTVGHSEFLGTHTHGFSGDIDGDSLLPDQTFSIGANNYKIARVVNGSRTNLQINLLGGAMLSNAVTLTATEKAALRVHVCDVDFDFSTATLAVTSYNWSGSLDWSPPVQTRTLYLSLPANHDATGDPTITGAATVGEMLTADATGIMDADGLTGVDFTYQWLRVDADGTSNEEEIPGETAETYTLTDDDVGKKVKVQVSFTDNLSGEEMRTSATTATVAATATTNAAPTVANAIPDQTATAGTVFGYTFPDTTFTDADGDTLGYAATQADDTALPSWLTFEGATRSFSGTPAAADVETVSVKVTASDGNGGSVSDEFDIVVSAAPVVTPTHCDTTDPNVVWCATLTPGDTGVGLGCSNFVATARCSSTAVLSDDDFTHASIDYAVTALQVNNGDAAFGVDADWATETDALTLVIGSTSLALADTDVLLLSSRTWFSTGISLTVGTAVEVKLIRTNTPATGAPTITGMAQVGQTLTAVTTGIMDADGLASPTYTYQWIRVETDSTEMDISGATSSTYTLLAADLGKTIKVRVSFADDAGNPETLTSVATATVVMTVSVPGPPRNLEAGPGDGQVTLSWDVPRSDGGAAIEKYLYRYSAGITVDPGATWADVPDADADGSLADERSVTVTGLENGQPYAFELRAVNSAGEGAAASATAMPMAIVLPPGEPESLTARVGDAQVTLSWTPPAVDGGAPIERYQYRYSAGSTVASNAAWMDVPDADSDGSRADERSVTVPDLGNARQYAFEVRAVNSAAVNGPAASAVATPVRAPLPPGSGFLVSNFGQTVDGAAQIFSTQDIVGVLTAGARGAGLHSIEFRLFSRLPGIAQLPSVTLYRASVTDTRATRGAQVATLTAVPGSSRPTKTARTVRFTAPAGTRLEAGAAYLVVLEETSYVRVESTTFPAEDAGGAPGWAVDGIGAGNNSPYSYRTTGSLLMRVNGTPAGATMATAPEAPASLGAAAGDARVTLSWTPPASDGGADIEKYQYRYSAGSRVDPGTAWVDVPDGSDTGASLADERSLGVTELDNGRQYAFELRAVNGVRAGAAATAGATPAAAPRSPVSWSAISGGPWTVLHRFTSRRTCRGRVDGRTPAPARSTASNSG